MIKNPITIGIPVENIIIIMHKEASTLNRINTFLLPTISFKYKQKLKIHFQFLKGDRHLTGISKGFGKLGWRIYKKFYNTMEKRTKFITEQKIKNNFMKGTYKSWGRKGYYMLHDTPIIQIGWANWNSILVSGRRGKICRINPYDYGEKKNHKPGVSLNDIKYLVESAKYRMNQVDFVNLELANIVLYME